MLIIVDKQVLPPALICSLCVSFDRLGRLRSGGSASEAQVKIFRTAHGSACMYFCKVSFDSTVTPTIVKCVYRRKKVSLVVTNSVTVLLPVKSI